MHTHTFRRCCRCEVMPCLFYGWIPENNKRTNNVAESSFFVCYDVLSKLNPDFLLHKSNYVWDFHLKCTHLPWTKHITSIYIENWKTAWTHVYDIALAHTHTHTLTNCLLSALSEYWTKCGHWLAQAGLSIHFHTFIRYRILMCTWTFTQIDVCR